ncbi:ABC transporter ATP-binding protein/permease [Dickeya dadantii]|uniref:ABC transporter ATP-binding protein/permease n=1 Tax=Dickeya dadantii TaxID=204038 RepID=UPI001CF2CA39|nr:ABC transporter ATP-binding protein/permease [Dickeya dadantii]MCA7013650.1 ABC transporter ATP-binding protein/permease [Dickeya dadantii]
MIERLLKSVPLPLTPSEPESAPLQPAARLSLREVWAVVTPYWQSADRRVAWLLVALILALVAIDTWVSRWLATFTKDFFDVLEARNAEPFIGMIWTSLAIVATSALSFASGRLLREILAFRWRRFMVEHFVARLFRHNAHYHLEQTQATDNPDQRIADDTNNFTSMTLSIAMSFISVLAQLVVYGAILWQFKGPAEWLGVDIPGFQLWAAILFGGGYSLITHLIGRRLSALLMEKERRAADFRFALVQQREAAEQIALYQGGQSEQQRLKRLFDAIAVNWRASIACTYRVDLAANAFLIAASLLPSFILAPRVFAGAATFGDLMQNQLAFTNVAIAVSWFGQAYTMLAEWSATTRRLTGLNNNLNGHIARKDGIALKDSSALKDSITVEKIPGQTAITTQGLHLHLPDGTALAVIDDVTIRPGERWLIRGPSGIGKSTLLRTMAGLWPHGSGRVTLPDGPALYFVPQKSYLPVGQLKEALTYPMPMQTYSDEQCAQTLRNCRLAHLVTALNQHERWAHKLSLGEQQRLAFARLLLARPDCLFLDEATSALDSATEAEIYRLLLTHLPAASVVSVAHRESLAACHEHTLVIDADRHRPSQPG